MNIHTIQTVFPDYENFSEIGKGGQSYVFCCQHRQSKLYRCVKSFNPKFTFAFFFSDATVSAIISSERERNLLALDCLYIIKYIDLRSPYILMEYAPNGSLYSYLQVFQNLKHYTFYVNFILF